MESSDDVPLSTEQVRALLERQIKVYENSRGIEMLAITLRASNKVVDYCVLTQIWDVDGVAEGEVGYRLMRESWGHGYVNEAASAVQVAKKLGMSDEKDVMCSCLQDGADAEHTTVLYRQITRAKTRLQRGSPSCGRTRTDSRGRCGCDHTARRGSAHRLRVFVSDEALSTRAELKQACERFATSEAVFFGAFSSAYRKMTRLGG